FSETAHKAGFEDGDIPIKADGKELTTLSGDMIRNIAEAKNVEVIRNGKTETITMPDEFMLKLIGANEKFASFRNPVVVKEAIKGNGAIEAGLQSGDSLTAINGKASPGYSDYARFIKSKQREKRKYHILPRRTRTKRLCGSR
ncbi:MAG: PDZ domain-containing protein, partial [Coprobacter fastidiosus]